LASEREWQERDATVIDPLLEKHEDRVQLAKLSPFLFEKSREYGIADCLMSPYLQQVLSFFGHTDVR
jgi:hypothetical protein